MLEEDEQPREAAPGLQREARGGTSAAGFLDDDVESRLPRLPVLEARPVAVSGRRGEAQVSGQPEMVRLEGKPTELLPPRLTQPSSPAILRCRCRSAAGEGRKKAPVLGGGGNLGLPLPSQAPFCGWHLLDLVQESGWGEWCACSPHTTTSTPNPSHEISPGRERRGREVPSRWEIFNIVVAIIGCFYWGLESQMALWKGWEKLMPRSWRYFLSRRLHIATVGFWAGLSGCL